MSQFRCYLVTFTRTVPIAVFLPLIIGCGGKQSDSLSIQEPRALAAIREIVAKQLDRPVDSVLPGATFRSLGADDLDLVEIIITAEKNLNISVDDDGLMRAAGTTDATTLVENLTIEKLAAFVDRAPRQPLQSDAPPNDGGLRAMQVGTFDELSKLPNPRGLELVFIPRLEEITAELERINKRKLTSTELAELRAKAAVIAMSPEDANKFRAEGSKR